MTPKGAWPRSRVLLLKQWDRYPRSTERISCVLCCQTAAVFHSLLVKHYKHTVRSLRRPDPNARIQKTEELQIKTENTKIEIAEIDSWTEASYINNMRSRPITDAC